MKNHLKSELLKEVISSKDNIGILTEIQRINKSTNKKIIVLDDDPTGTQTVHDVTVLTVWDMETLKKAFLEDGTLFFILTNSRSLNSGDAETLLSDIMLNICLVSKELGIDFAIVDRGDSTLRGHYPLEGEVIRSVIERELDKKVDGEIIIPFFKEGKRFTLNDIHWVEDGEWWIPAGETEFARDAAFGYKNSNLKLWVEEKTGGRYPARDVVSVSLEDIRTGGDRRVCQILMGVENFGKVIVNSIDYSDMEVFVSGLLIAEAQGSKNFIYRTAASFVRVRGGIQPRELLRREELVKEDNKHGGLIVVGSHVKKSTKQLENAMEAKNTVNCEVSVEKLLYSDESRMGEIERAVKTAEKEISSGRNIIIYTSRNLVKAMGSNREDNLNISQLVSESLVSIVKGIKVSPRFIIAKGGITSSDIGTKALEIKMTKVLGQVRQGIPVWSVGDSCYIIFPGNVGTEYDLKDIIEQLS